MPPSNRFERTLECVPASYRRCALRHYEPRATIVPDIGNPSPEVELNGYTKRVKPTAQVGHGARNGDLPKTLLK